MKTIKIFGLAFAMLLSLQLVNAHVAQAAATTAIQQLPPPPPRPPAPHRLHRPPFHKHLRWHHRHANLHLPPHPPAPPAPPAHP